MGNSSINSSEERTEKENGASRISTKAQRDVFRWPKFYPNLGVPQSNVSLLTRDM